MEPCKLHSMKTTLKREIFTVTTYVFYTTFLFFIGKKHLPASPS